MKKHSIIVLTLLAGCFTNSFAQKGEKTLTVEVSNEWKFFITFPYSGGYDVETCFQVI